MSKKNSIGKTKRSTDDLIDNAIAQQNDWLENRRTYTRGFLKSLNVFAKKSDKNTLSIEVVLEEITSLENFFSFVPALNC